MLYQVTAPHFCAGIIANQAGRIVCAAPILAWLLGRDIGYARFYCEKNLWGIEQI